MANGFPPNREADLVTFTQNFSAKISSDPQRYSLTAPQAANYANLSDAFISAYQVANDKATRSPMNISLKSAAKESLLANLRMLARIVQSSPTTTNAIRDDLSLRHRGNAPTRMAAPGTPNRFAVSLDPTGSLTLRWKCDNPTGSSGTMYQIWRRIAPPGAAGEFQHLGVAGSRKFVDMTIPAGSPQVTYRVQAVRTKAVGAYAEFGVNLGAVSGVRIASVTEPAGPKRMAA
jgi:hypothetical protein